MDEASQDEEQERPAQADQDGDRGSADGDPAASKETPVVAIGSSAGGYEATKELFASIPPDTGMGFVLVPHLDPTHESHLADLLRRDTSMPVREAADGTRVEANHVYVIAPNTIMVIEDGVLRLTERIKVKERTVLVIDRFFRSLAESYEERAVGIILSGALADGTNGIQEIKAAGGFALAQDPDTANFPEMPRSAIDTGVIDITGSPTDLAKALAELNPQLKGSKRGPAHQPTGKDPEEALEQVLDALHRSTGMDFREYKRSTLIRRIERRMIARKKSDLLDYARLVAESAEEAERLHREILILVTRFFRDPETDDALVEHVLPGLFENRAYRDPVRIWVAGCSTGEEAYSLAILVTEYMEKHNLAVPVNVFATDLSAAAIRTAREGYYPEAIRDNVPEDRLARFFEPAGNGYRIRKHIRGMCVFAEHNLVGDPPFSNMDIASCRNVLVYMRPPLQRRAIEALHYSLRAGGILILGEAEAIGRSRDLFGPTNGARNILSKRDVPTTRMHEQMAGRVPYGAATGGQGSPEGEGEQVGKEVDRLLLERYSPSGVVVDKGMKVLHFRGGTSRFIKHGAGPASLDLMQMVPDPLSQKIRSAVSKVDQTGGPVRGRKVRFEHEGQSVLIDLEVLPLRKNGTRNRNYLVIFNEASPRQRPRPAPPKRRTGLMDLLMGQSRQDLEDQVQRLQKEMSEAREHLKHVTSDHQEAVEELRSANEEAISTNEELQSTNEELETTKDELQSTNEELTTLNDELNARNKELQDTNNDMVNLLHSVELPIIMLGPDLKIRRFTDRARELFEPTQMEVDRPLSRIQATFDREELDADLVEVLKTYQRVERTIQTHKGSFWTLKIHPYRTSEDKVEGVVLVATEKRGS